MKLDKIKFAKVVSWISRMTNGLEFTTADLQDLDDIIDIETPAIDIDALHTLMGLMQEGTRKIEVIKQYRNMTGYGLRESKDIVEKYWPKSNTYQEKFIKELAEWEGTTDSWFDLFENFRRQAKEVLKLT